jgi:hypothetical protein
MQAWGSGGDVEPLGRTDGVIYGACAGIWVMLVFAEPKKRDMLAARGTLQAMLDRHREGFPTLTWVLPAAGYHMDGDARQAASDVTRSFASSIRAQATLIPGTGFQAATVRSIVAGLDFMTRSASPKKVFGELGPAVTWCLSHVPGRKPRSDEGSIGAALLAMQASAAAP